MGLAERWHKACLQFIPDSPQLVNHLFLTPLAAGEEGIYHYLAEAERRHRVPNHGFDVTHY
jgi:hypothetical protein